MVPTAEYVRGYQSRLLTLNSFGNKDNFRSVKHSMRNVSFCSVFLISLSFFFYFSDELRKINIQPPELYDTGIALPQHETISHRAAVLVPDPPPLRLQWDQGTTLSATSAHPCAARLSPSPWHHVPGTLPSGRSSRSASRARKALARPGAIRSRDQSGSNAPDEDMKCIQTRCSTSQG